MSLPFDPHQSLSHHTQASSSSLHSTITVHSYIKGDITVFCSVGYISFCQCLFIKSFKHFETVHCHLHWVYKCSSLFWWCDISRVCISLQTRYLLGILCNFLNDTEMILIGKHHANSTLRLNLMALFLFCFLSLSTWPDSGELDSRLVSCLLFIGEIHRQEKGYTKSL